MLVNAYSTLVKEQPDPGCAAGPVQRRGLLVAASDLGDRPRAEPELAGHLAELADYARAATADQPPAAGRAVADHLRRTMWQYAFQWDQADPAQLTGWARQANAILYLEGGNLVDPDGGSLLACGADGMPLGRVPLRADAVARAAAVREALQDKGVTVAASLPPSRGVGEVLTQPARDVGLRILALALVADFSQSVLAGAPIDPARMWQAYPRAMTGFTPEEDRLFRTWDRDAAYQLSWRSEAADILLWATARAPLDFPRAQRDPRETFGTIFTGTEGEFVAATTLRPVHELLAEQERARGLLWAIQQAELAGGPPVRGVDGGVVLERLIALTWLLDWRVDWDDVDTSS